MLFFLFVSGLQFYFLFRSFYRSNQKKKAVKERRVCEAGEYLDSYVVAQCNKDHQKQHSTFLSSWMRYCSVAQVTKEYGLSSNSKFYFELEDLNLVLMEISIQFINFDSNLIQTLILILTLIQSLTQTLVLTFK